MTAPIHPHGPGNSRPEGPAGGGPVACVRCGADGGLTLHSITAVSPPSDVLVEVGYSCDACNLHYVGRADVAAVAAVFSRLHSPKGVLVFGGHYVHCEQPMHKIGSKVRSLSARGFSDGPPEDASGVSLTAQVLRCSCGFHMDVPE
ncbi:hypothetical protein [Pseudarthrobacter raffinosi]|uniref:hypothetical protein n=1 Tax=Pseudarthrobacter raffinosi TaxID=2953651 RepID=UPI00208F6CD0|nr:MULTISPECIES: hypothetical protein [unclassified Pseudarthrobacter]MCO4236288.1 hypothetical protein [Pseudarthrobacter sp. MDT3-28]MCO4250394.1 hypothetical protein [Pseudarthrobacter sp. MDT3-9]